MPAVVGRGLIPVRGEGMPAKTIADWLTQIGLPQYAELFAQNEIDLEVLPELGEQDLEKLGVPLGHRKKLLKASSVMQSEVAQRLTERSPGSAAEGQAERRQLTVMFCDLVGSTLLSQQLDPEQLRELMHAYQQACGAVVDKYDGHVAQYLGDGLMVYFGWPRAHEDDAERAIRAALEVVDGVKNVQAPAPLRVRVGIATGPVVVGETGAGDASVPKAAVGETPNRAARLQGLAGADEIVISPSTRRLAGGAFEYADLGEHVLKGIVEPVRVWRVTGVGVGEGRFEAIHGNAELTPLVGRDEELALLLRRWRLAAGGEGQVVLLCGEPGIGKSRVTRALRESIQHEAHTRLRYQCSPFHTQSALYPVIDQLERAAGFTKEDRADDRLDKVEAVLGLAREQQEIAFIAPLFAALLSLPIDRYPPLNYSPQKQKERTLDALVDQVAGLTKQQPVFIVFEDVHWVDPTTHEVLDLLVPRIAELPVLLLITYRPEFHPDWTGAPHVTALTLNRLNRRLAARLAAKVTGGKALPPEVLDQIVEKTDGMPLFVEELTKHVLESGLLEDRGDRYALAGPLSSLAIPSTLRDSLMARLDRLAPVRELAQLCAVVGREFSHELIAAVSPLREPALTEALSQLAQSQLIFRQGVAPEATYMFKHALVQDAAYESLLKSIRQRFHQRVATALVERFPEEVAARPAFVAHHYTEAGLPQQAIKYWTHAGQLALQRSANVEAISHFTKGLDLLRLVPPAQVDSRQELALWLGLGPAYLATRGFSTPEVEQAALRSRELCEKLGEVEGAALAIVGKFAFHFVRAELQQARVEADAGLALAQRIEDPQLVALMNMLIGDMCYWEGKFGTSRRHLSAALIPWNVSTAKSLAERSGLDAHCIALAYVAHNELATGYPDRSQATIAEALRDAQKLGHAQTLGHCLGLAAWLAVFRRDPVAARQLANRTIDYCHEQRLTFWEPSGYLADGWALIQERKVGEGTKRMHQGFAIRRAAGAALVHSSFHAVLAECHGKAGEFDTGLALIDEALVHVEESGERLSESELCRVRGELLLSKTSDVDAAAECFERAIKVAREQEAKLFELRATSSLARLWRDQEKRKEAYGLIAPVYDWFTEGFGTKDLNDAKAVLAELKA